VRERRAVLDGLDVDAGVRERANGRLAAGARARDKYLILVYANLLAFVGDLLGRGLGR
jgi:hypothetical protein